MPRKHHFQPNDKYLRAAEAYKGRWVVVRRDEILLAGDDPRELERQARERGLEYDVIQQVPSEDPEPLIL